MFLNNNLKARTQHNFAHKIKHTIATGRFHESKEFRTQACKNVWSRSRISIKISLTYSVTVL